LITLFTLLLCVFAEDLACSYGLTPASGLMFLALVADVMAEVALIAFIMGRL